MWRNEIFFTFLYSNRDWPEKCLEMTDSYDEFGFYKSNFPPRGASDLRKFQFDSTEFSFRQSWIKVLSALVENRHREGLDSCMEALVLSYYNSYRPNGSDSIEKNTFPSADREFDSVYYCTNRPNLSKPKNYNFKYPIFKPLQRVSSRSMLGLIMLHKLYGSFVS